MHLRQGPSMHCTLAICHFAHDEVLEENEQKKFNLALLKSPSKIPNTQIQIRMTSKIWTFIYCRNIHLW